MRCSVCRASLILGEKFCGECGTARSELPPQFENTEREYNQLKRRVHGGTITQAEFENALHELVIRDEQGSPWMIGSDSEEWFRFDGTDWQREDPPERWEPAARAKKPSAPRAAAADRTKPPSSASKPKKKPAPSRTTERAGGGRPRWLMPVGGCLLAIVLLCGIGLMFRQPLTNAFARVALDQGWGTVIEEAEVVPDMPAMPANPPAATIVAPKVVPPTRAPTKIPTPRATNPSTQWTTWQFSRAGVAIPVPPGFIVKPQDEGLAYLYDETQAIAIEIEYREASADTTWQIAMLSWMTQLTNITMGPIPFSTPVGDASFAVTESTEGTWYYAMVGPTKDHRVIYLRGTAPEADWPKAQELFIKMTKEIEYSR